MAAAAFSEASIPTLLIVDDTPANLGVVAAHLEDKGFDVSIANNGEDGIKRALRVRPDLILLDVMMPGINGFETCRRLKAMPETRDIPVIFMTALSDTDDKLTGFEAGGVDYVTKPIQIAEVLVRINTHLALRAAAEQLARHNRVLQEELEARRRAEMALDDANQHLSEALKSLQNSQERLVRSAKLAGLGALVSGIAHELNTPIGNALLTASTIRTEVQSLRSQMAGGTLRRTAFENFLLLVERGTEMLDSSLRRSGDLVQKFKQIAVLQKSNQRGEFCLDALIRDATMSFQLQTGRIPFAVEFDVDPSIIMESYFLTFEHVLSNLYSNALRHAFDNPAEGHVRIEGTMAGNDWVRLVFSDNGKGIPLDRLGNIFDPFYTTQLGQGSSGIGLYTVHNQVTQLLGGRIDVESTLGKGTRFVIDVPRVAAA